MTHLTRYFAPILILLCLPVTHASAEVWLGLQIGNQSASLSGTLSEGARFTTRNAIAAAAVIDIPIATDVRLSLQPAYCPRGAVIAVDVPGENESKDSIEVALDYFTIPVMGRVVAGNGVGYLIGGLEFGFLLNAKWEPVGEPAEDISDSLRSFDLAANLGVGAMPRIYRDIRAVIELRYSQSLFNVAKSGQSSSLPRMKYTGWQFWLGAIIPVGNK